MDWLNYENEALSKGYNNICGVDEAGRGPLAGPVCAAAVILPKGEIIQGVNDSKKLTEKKREALYDVIKEKAVAYSIAFASVEEIEEMLYHPGDFEQALAEILDECAFDYCGEF